MYGLRVEDIHKRYGSHEVLRGVPLGAGKGDVISIVGSSDSGKSTFLHCVSFLEKSYTRHICVGNEEPRARPDTLDELCTADPRQLQRVHSRLAMVFQCFNLWSHLIVLKNVVEYPVDVLRMNRDDIVACAHHYLIKVSLAKRAERQYSCELSDGQRQRVTVARALAMEPQMMLFDGPTPALDPELVDEALKVVQQLVGEGRAMVLVTHGMAFARQVSSRMIFLHQGVIEEQGTPDQVFDALHGEHLHQFLTGNLK